MSVTKLGDNITVIDDKIRIEPGPRRRTRLAEAGIFYRPSRAADPETGDLGDPGQVGEVASHYRLGGPDANAKRIELGEEFTYINRRDPEPVHYVYRLEDGVWTPHGFGETFNEALSLAMELV